MAPSTPPHPPPADRRPALAADHLLDSAARHDAAEGYRARLHLRWPGALTGMRGTSSLRRLSSSVLLRRRRCPPSASPVDPIPQVPLFSHSLLILCLLTCGRRPPPPATSAARGLPPPLHSAPPRPAAARRLPPRSVERTEEKGEK
ncbi:Os06g0189450 [Oryza sativa Japonica Group]|uniref:Os06g0189450 protein n=1 Tax=Oryza sativa subsp. japonica TaxID=39947 RepID=A0A0N7KLP0_ORYSJ|nr:Os06g0189450 [Oryza sativa Japonica Group]